MPKTKILIVEDEAIVAADLAAKLEQLGYSVCGIAASGEDAVALIRMCLPDLVLIDIRLQGQMDGIEAAGLIRQEFGLPVIYLTAHSDRVMLDRAKRTEPFGYILKPFELHKLETHIEMALYKYQAERTLRESEERLLTEVQRQAAELDATLGAMADGLIIYDATGSIVRISVAAAEALDYKGDEHGEQISTRIAKVKVEHASGKRYHPREMPAMRAFAGETVHQEVMVLRNPDRTYWVSTSAAPIIGKDGLFLGVILTATDITELHAMQEQMETFMHLVSHDLRTPLAIIHGYVNLLVESLPMEENPMVQLSVDAIQRSVKRMGMMIDDLVLSARLEGGQMPVNCTPCNLIAWLPEFIGRMSTVFDPQRLQLAMPAVLPILQVDTFRLERILTNLISNALKYGDPDKPVQLSAQQTDNQVRISVTDQGHGIDPEHIPHLFEKFYRADTNRKAEGIGLGLYITRLLVEAHGGRLWAESEVEVGSTFNFTLKMP